MPAVGLFNRASPFPFWGFFMSSNVFVADVASRRYCRLALLSSVFLISIFCCCNKTPTNPVSAPTITTQPASQTITVGQSVAFTVVTSGNPAPTYQWRKNGTAITGATNASYIIPSVALTDAATYDVVVANSQGSVASTGATLMVTTGCPHPPNALDTVYRIISPNGGETFHVGDQCTVRVMSKLSGSALLNIVIGRYTLFPPSGPLSQYMQGNSAVDTIIFTIPDSLTQLGGGNVSSVTDSCLLEINKYTDEGILDYSDCYFRIENP